MSYKEYDNRPINKTLNPLEQFVPNWRTSPSELLQNQQIVSKYGFKDLKDGSEVVHRQRAVFTPCLRFEKLKYEPANESNIILRI